MGTLKRLKQVEGLWRRLLSRRRPLPLTDGTLQVSRNLFGTEHAEQVLTEMVLYTQANLECLVTVWTRLYARTYDSVHNKLAMRRWSAFDQ